MQNAKKAKTESAHNKLALTAFVSLIFLGLFSLVILNLNGRLVSGRVCSGSSCVYLERAVTSAQQQKGLSGRSGMPVRAGMIFVFDKPDYQCMWMKDMRFDLDMLWLNNSGRVIKIVRGVSPATYPETFCGRGARYVIELNSVEARRLGWNVGDSLQL
jgi:uncharacterized membrane protein (UPF0127 family)